MEVTLRAAQPGDLSAITRIYNDAVLNTTATFDTQPKTDAEQLRWFNQHRQARHPIVVAECVGEILGWASLSRYSDRCAYSDTAEVSVYVAARVRGQGIGRKLLALALETGRQAGLHSAIARIVEGNVASVRLHESLGFSHVGTMREVGRKFGRLLDVQIMQLIFPEGEPPEVPKIV